MYSETVFRIHVNDCFLILMRMIKCQADLSHVLFQLDHSDMGQWKTRDAPHRCKNFDKMVDW